MALQKNITLDTGYEANYHKISGVDLSIGQINISLYKDFSARTEGKSCLRGTSVSIPMSLLSEENLKIEGNSPVKIAYDYLKTTDEFSGSYDV